MKLTEVMRELTARGVSDDVVERILLAFQAEARIVRRNEYSRRWAVDKRAQKSG